MSEKIVLSATLKIRGGCEGGGKGALVQWEKSATLSTLQDQTLFVWKETDQDLRTKETDGR
jgi:hypothetical protein